MYTTISALFAIVPAVFFVWYYYRQDKRKPEPKGLVLRIFLAGLGITVPVMLVELIVEKFEAVLSGVPLGMIFFRAFVVAALCEEWFKLTIVKQYAYRNVNFDEIMDGVVYTIAASMGFACMENVLYVKDGAMGVALIRAFSAVPMHAVASGMMGYYVGKAKFAGDPKCESTFLRRGLWIAVLIHGLYDVLVFAASEFHELIGLGIVPLLLVAFLQLRWRIRTAIREDIQRVLTTQQTRPVTGDSSQCET